tara:strand:+ start:11619 stop:12482 length:864 start_codon:yes stop_codon:yes gene_type:complete
MKYYSLIFLICCFSACSGTKPIVRNIPKKTSEIKKEINDTIIKKVIIFNEESDSAVNSNETLKDSIQEKIIPPKPLYFSVWNNLLQKYVSENGNINYLGFKNNWANLKIYIESLSKNIPNNNSTKEEKLAYWINAYNAFTIDLILRNYPIKSIKDIKDPWDQRLWKLGDKWYNLEGIEHQILRKMDEPRIHFAIVCASHSCPKLLNEAYTASNLELQLTNATKDFLADNKRNNITANNLKLSKIFQWFSKDFKQNGSLIGFLNNYSAIKISNKAKTSFNDHNWSLNE